MAARVSSLVFRALHVSRISSGLISTAPNVYLGEGNGLMYVQLLVVRSNFVAYDKPCVPLCLPPKVKTIFPRAMIATSFCASSVGEEGTDMVQVLPSCRLSITADPPGAI